MSTLDLIRTAGALALAVTLVLTLLVVVLRLLALPLALVVLVLDRAALTAARPLTIGAMPEWRASR